MLHRHNTTSTHEYDLSTSKQLAQQHCAELMKIAKNPLILTPEKCEDCETQTVKLLTAINNLHIYIENFPDHLSCTTKEELYKFQNQLHQDNINKITRGIIDIFTKKDEHKNSW